jgi:isochorismate synthase
MPRVRAPLAAGAPDKDLPAPLLTLIERGLSRAASLRRPILISSAERVRDVDPLAILHRESALQMYWAVPRDGFSLAGLGAAVGLEGSGAWRFSDISRAWMHLRGDALVASPDDAVRGAGPVIMGGFSFEPSGPRSTAWRGFPAASFVVPQVSLARRGDDSWLTFNTLVDPDTDAEELARDLAAERGRILSCSTPAAPVAVANRPAGQTDPESAHRWRAMVERALDAIRAGTLEKVVLARAVEMDLGTDEAFDAVAALAHLRDTQPNAFVYGIWRDDAVFLGATPERLATVRDGAVETSVLAGSAPRGSGVDEDAMRVHGLRESAKDREEHEIVRRAIHSLLTECCADVASAAEPSVVTLPAVHHLHTAVHARLRSGRSALDVVEQLHPTPALGGAPREAALAFIREHEGLDRGWYASPIGWMDRHDAEFAVALRSALVRDGTAILFAGCGIVAQSDPDAELEESSVKLGTALEAVRVGSTPGAG